MATVFALEFTAPAWVSLMAVLFLGERLTLPRIGAVVLGFIGVMVIIQPGVETFQMSTLVILSAALCFSISIVTQKMLTKSDTTYSILFIMNLLQLPLALIGVYFSGSFFFIEKLALSDLLPVLGIAQVAYLMVANPQFAPNTLQEVFALARAKVTPGSGWRRPPCRRQKQKPAQRGQLALRR